MAKILDSQFSPKPVLFLMGPTASGKTDLAVKLADRYPIDLVSVDSALVYRFMDMGTAKPDAALRARYPHALIDIRDPDQTYCAGDFRRDALACINAIHARGRLPLLVGGTGLYFRSLERGIAEIPEILPDVREAIDREAASKGWPAMHAGLGAVDAESAARIHPNDRQRIQRALAVFRSSGQPLSVWQAKQRRSAFPFPLLKLALLPERDTLHARIEKRLAFMLDHGFLQEVRGLLQRGYGTELPALRAVGYRQLIEYLAGQTGYQAACQEALHATRQLAKRQMTWLRAERLDLMMAECEIGSQVARTAGVIDAFLQNFHMTPKA